MLAPYLTARTQAGSLTLRAVLRYGIWPAWMLLLSHWSGPSGLRGLAGFVWEIGCCWFWH
jgi:hypothetical protein